MTRSNDIDLQEAMEELSSAEDFLEFFEIPYDKTVVHVNRLHIMQRYHDYLKKSSASLENYDHNDDAMYAVYKVLLSKAYEDFVNSDAKTEKVLKIYKMQGPQSTFVSLDTLMENG